MTPNDIGQLAATFGPTGAILLVMWINRTPKGAAPTTDPLANIAIQLQRIETLLNRIEAIVDRSRK